MPAREFVKAMINFRLKVTAPAANVCLKSWVARRNNFMAYKRIPRKNSKPMSLLRWVLIN